MIMKMGVNFLTLEARRAVCRNVRIPGLELSDQGTFVQDGVPLYDDSVLNIAVRRVAMPGSFVGALSIIFAPLEELVPATTPPTTAEAVTWPTHNSADGEVAIHDISGGF